MQLELYAPNKTKKLKSHVTKKLFYQLEQLVHLRYCNYQASAQKNY